MKITILVAALICFTCGSTHAQTLSALKAKNYSFVPDLVGMSLREAKKTIKTKRFIVGALITDSGTDTTLIDKLIVYKQNPPAKNSKGLYNRILKGKVIDIWLGKALTIEDTLSKTRDTLSR
jgi:beta-lactam-binding protein with PASTA domain